MFLANMSSASERLTSLPKTDRADWGAVGLVISRGTTGTVVCSGTLVAPDLVVTAAHCLTRETPRLEGVQFIAGLDGTRRAATSTAVKVLRYPVWDFATGNNRVRLDLAVLRLGRLIKRDKLQPVSVLPAEKPLPSVGALLGYQENETSSLNGRFDCVLERSRVIGILFSDCLVAPGNSGGPVFVKDDGQWLLAGIIVALDRANERSILVGVNTWLLDQIKQAEEREAARAQTASDELR